MLATTLPLYNADGSSYATFTKVAESQKDGALYRKPGTSVRSPDTLLVKATFAKPGAKGNDRILVQRAVYYQPVDANSMMPVGAPVPLIVNITLNVPRIFLTQSDSETAVDNAVVQALSVFLSKDSVTALGSKLSAFGSQIIDGEL